MPLAQAGQEVVPALVDADVRPADQRPGGVHARRRVHPRRERRGRVLRRRRLLRPRHRRRRRHRQGDGRVDRRSGAADGPVEDGHPPVRPAVRQPRLLPRPDRRGLLDLLRHRVPQPRAPGRAAAAHAAAPTPATSSSAPSSARRAAGSGSTGTARTRTRRTSSCARRAGRAEHWSTAIVTEHLATRTRGRALRRVELRQDRGQRPGRRRRSSSGCAPTASTGPSARSRTRRC